MKDNQRMKGICLVSMGTLLWGVSGTVAQYLFQQAGFTPEWLVVVRMLCAGILLLLFSLIRRDKNVLAIWRDKKSVGMLLIFSLFGMLGVQYKIGRAHV